MKKTIVSLFIAILPFLATAQTEGLEIGNIAPEFEAQGTGDFTIKLSDLKGKVVLIDFWASWCGPCRRENPNVMDAWSEFHNKSFSCGDGFEVFSVSLDQNKKQWLKAIDDDNLVWNYHVSDLKGWYSEVASLYQVDEIPANFLIDKDGVIIAKNLRGTALAEKLNEIVKLDD
ncbi:MAG: TlpA family protein disulfide reductase [Alphaproteobacteria bacterium]|nr:TlpA family protein disulfide reductase [Alphaproteobacteria bacterium]